MIHEKIKLLRISNKLTQAQLAEKLNMSPNAYNRLEKGKSFIHVDQVVQIALCLRIEASQLIDERIVFEFRESKHNQFEINIENERTREHYQQLISSKDKQIEELLKQNEMLKTSNNAKASKNKRIKN